MTIKSLIYFVTHWLHMQRQIKVSESVYARLKALSERSGIPMARLVSDWVEKNESHKVVKKMGEEEKDIVMCDECEEEIPKDASFCPYCGVEFGEDEDIEETEEED